MAGVVVRAPVDREPLRAAFAQIRAEFSVPADFPADVVAEANAAAARHAGDDDRRDARDVPFVTIDPAGSRDLDQAYHAERRNAGYRVHYAIADVAAFVRPGGALDAEVLRRAVTLYLPDGRAPMLPEVLCEGAASLLAGADRPAVLWTIDLDAHGEAVTTRVERAMVRSRAARSFTDVQAELDRGTADDAIALLAVIGPLRRELEAARGGISLDLPDQEVVPRPDGSFSLAYRAPLAVEAWNAQISLLTGIEAAKLLVDAHAGILRTLPPPQPQQLDRLRRTAHALGVAWPDGASWGDVVARLDRSRPGDAAFLIQAAHVLRGAGYAALDATNTATPSAVPIQAGVGAPYAHVTAPMRRLVDRYATEVALAACAGRTPPEWATQSVPAVVTAMDAALHRSAAIERAVVDAVECAVLADHVGDTYDGVVVDRHEHGVVVQLTDPAVVTVVAADETLGARVRVRLAAVDPVARHLDLEPV